MSYYNGNVLVVFFQHHFEILEEKLLGTGRICHYRISTIKALYGFLRNARAVPFAVGIFR